MLRTFLLAVAVASVAVFGPRAEADVVSFQFSGAGTGGSGLLTVAPDTVAGDPVGAFTISGISGTMTDTNIANFGTQTITGLVPISPVNPPQGAPFPMSLSLFNVVNPPPGDSAISYDNLYYPGGSPITCVGYLGFGGFLDIYGVMFTLGNGDVVDLWSNGAIPGGPPLNYGVAVIDPMNTVLDFQVGGLRAVPEPGSLCLLATGVLGGLAWRRRSAESRGKVSSAN